MKYKEEGDAAAATVSMRLHPMSQLDDYHPSPPPQSAVYTGGIFPLDNL